MVLRQFTSKRRAALVGVVAGGLVLSGSLAGAAPGVPLSEKGGAARLNGDQTRSVRQSVEGGRARNVILLIGDGMGDSEITSARNYAYGAAGRFPGIDALPLTGQYTTYSLYKRRQARLRPRLGGDRQRPGRPAPRPTTTRSRSTSTGSRRPRCSSWPRPGSARPATSPPQRCRTPPRPCRPRTSRSAPATARRPRPGPAPRQPWRTVGSARSPSRSSAPAPT